MQQVDIGQKSNTELKLFMSGKGHSMFDKADYLQEITSDWKCEFRVPQHTYLVLGMRCVGYIKENTTELTIFDKPMQFDKRKRKFNKLTFKDLSALVCEIKSQ